jgi:hypothetical protein
MLEILDTREEGETLRMREARDLQLLCEGLARGFRVSQRSGDPRRPLISSIWMQ